MRGKKVGQMDPAAILSTLEHISQAIDAMTAVVDELRGYLDGHCEATEASHVALDPEELEFAELDAGERTVH